MLQSDLIRRSEAKWQTANIPNRNLMYFHSPDLQIKIVQKSANPPNMQHHMLQAFADTTVKGKKKKQRCCYLNWFALSSSRIPGLLFCGYVLYIRECAYKQMRAQKMEISNTHKVQHLYVCVDMYFSVYILHEKYIPSLCYMYI